MKKNYIFKFILLAIPVSAFTLLSFSSGNPNALSGSPGDGGNNCTQCHVGSAASSSNLTIVSDIPVTGYEFNKEYNVTITNSNGNVRNGFQVTAERDSNNAKTGTFISTSSDTQVAASGSRIIHTSSGNNRSSWTFKWRSPSTDQGKVTFYGASVSGNGSGSGGDQVFLGKSGSTPSLSIVAAQRLDFDMFPNPATENVNIQLSSEVTDASVEFYDYVGRLALSKKVTKNNTKINVSDLASGVYLLKVISEDKIGSQKFIKR